MAREQKDVKFRLDREQMPYSFVGLDTADGDAAIFVWHGKFPREINCGGAHTYMQRLIGEDFSFSSFFDQHDTIERADAGQVFTTTFKRSRKYPNHEMLASTICRTSGEVAYIVFGYAHGYPQQARDLVMRTFAFNGEQTLLGDWDGEGVVLTFNANGTAAMSFTSAPFSPNRGTYRISDGHVIFSWDVMMGVPKAGRRDCGYALRGDKLTLSCDDGRTMAFHR